MLYNQLIDQYFVLIFSDDWVTKREALVQQMDSVWNKMSANERVASLDYCEQLYLQRIKS